MQPRGRSLPRPSRGSQGSQRAHCPSWAITFRSSSWVLQSGHRAEGSTIPSARPAQARLRLVRAESPEPRVAWPSRLWRVHLPRSSTPLTVARTSGPAPPKHLPLSLLPHPLGTAFPIPAQKNDPGPAGSSSGMSPQPPPRPDLQVGFEVITSAQPRAAGCSEPLQASQESPWDKHRGLANFKRI